MDESKGTRVRVSPEAHYGLRLMAAELTKRSGGRKEFSLVDAIDFAVARGEESLGLKVKNGKP
jgi:hypothetical protein